MNIQEIVPGTLVHGRYIVRVRIGEGGGGIVYRAFDTNLESWVILKQIKESTVRPDDRRTEVNILKELRHQRIPKVLDYFVYEGHVYTVMDFISGRDFGTMLREYGRFDEKRVLKWAGQLADVLAYIHTRKPPIVHSDIKPSNIMVDQNDELTLIDFNISRIFQKDRRDGSWISAGYSAPEQFGDIAVYEQFRRDRAEKGDPVSYRETLPAELFSKQIDPRTDVYSFGATLYHFLTGTRPNPLYEGIRPLSKTGVPVSAGLMAVIERCMQADQELRYRNGSELVDALNALNRGTDHTVVENDKTLTRHGKAADKQTGPAYRRYTGEETGAFFGISGEGTGRFMPGAEYDDMSRGDLSERYGGRSTVPPDSIPGAGRTNPYTGGSTSASVRPGNTSMAAGREGNAEWTTGTEGLRKSRRTAKILAGLTAAAACAIVLLGIAIWRTGGTENQSGGSRETSSNTTTGSEVSETPVVVTPTTAPAPTDITESTPADTAAPKPTVRPVPASLRCTVSESAPSNFKSLRWYPFETSDASSYLIQNTEIYYDNQPHSAADGDIVTSWQEGAAGLGIGETLWLGYESPKEISCLVLHLGNWRTEEIYGNNARPKSFRLRIGSWSQDITFKNGMTVKYVMFSEPCEVEELEFVITAVYEGIDQDCCISEIEAYGR
ncbi:MAG: protein kinase [Lachnospiraceae bacterium]|nr:protein kinase [Lachnospiraceae bacterium]